MNKPNPKSQQTGKAIKRYREKFANPDVLSSAAQFNPKYKGTLFQDFEQFLEEELSLAEQKGREEGIEIIKEKRKEIWQFYHEAQLWTEQKQAVKPYDEIIEALKKQNK